MAEKRENILNVKSLKEQVYEYLREEIHRQHLQPGSVINMDATSKKLGISKTPLRDALIQLEMEGFVTIAPRRGIFVNELTLQDIKDFYQVIGALEQSAILQSGDSLTARDIEQMNTLNRQMERAIEKDNFDHFYEKNLAFHNTYIRASRNQSLIHLVDNLKKRLYDFPRQKGWIKEWEASSIKEHQELVDLLKARKITEAASFIHDVHWSFQVQEPFILRYHFPPAPQQP
jgi:DNA-binding GntR family transcriptional regulator